MSNSPLVSVIVPVYNVEAYLRQCLDSIVNQSYRNLEIILVNDGSTDSSGRICNEYASKDSRILVIEKENGGASSARNVGIKQAHGEYIYFADSDDLLELRALETLSELAIKQQVDCIFFEAYNLGESKEITVKRDGLSFHAFYPVIDGKSLIPMLLQNKDYHAAPYLYFIKAKVIQGLSFEEGIMMEDELFSFQLLRTCNSVKCLKQKLYRRKMRAGSVMTTTGKGCYRFKSITRVLEKIIAIHEEDGGLDTQKYLERIGVLWMGRHDELTPPEKDQVTALYSEMLEKLHRVHCFGSLALKVRLWGYYPWLLITMPERISRKIRFSFARVFS